MKIQIDRRRFLLGLAGLGAAISLPARPTTLETDQAWATLKRSPWFFEITESNTIVEPDVAEPKIRRDIYDINVAGLKSPEDVIAEVEKYDELRGHFTGLSSYELDEVNEALEDEELAPSERVRLEALRDLLEDEDEGWRDWVEAEGPSRVQRFQAEIDSWLDDDVDWSQMEFWPSGWSGQGRALAFFQQLEREARDAVGAVIVEGEHPGSTYFAVELHASVAAANDAAARFGLPIRFREAR